MKKLAVAICLSALTTGAFAQGLVNFANNASTLISSGSTGNTAVLAAGNPGAFYFGLLIAPAGTTDPTKFTFTGNYGTNQTFAGRFTGGGGITVNGWAPGATMAYEVAGWSAGLGATFQSSWLTSSPATATEVFGLSVIGTGQAGGAGPTGPLPNWNIFGGTGITSGFNLAPGGAPVPEPTSMALAGLGAAALLIFRRRK